MVGKDLLSHLIDNNYNFTEEDIIYDYQGKYFTFVGAGSNGFIVTAFPTG